MHNILNLTLIAYTDPGSGLLLWQVIGAAAVGILFQVSQLRQKVSKWFSDRRRTRS